MSMEQRTYQGYLMYGKGQSMLYIYQLFQSRNSIIHYSLHKLSHREINLIDKLASMTSFLILSLFHRLYKLNLIHYILYILLSTPSKYRPSRNNLMDNLLHTHLSTIFQNYKKCKYLQ